MRICKLADPRLYPENVSHEYRGQYYCFLSDKLFYRNAFYMFSDEYAAFLLSNILDSRDLPLAEPIIAEYPYDATDIKEHIAYSDHVFVGKVTSVENYWASEKPKMLSDDGETYNTKLPFTEYCVEVIEPIKGELEAAETIRIRKTGGLNYLEDKVIMLADDILPEKGKRYIFLVTENKDGIMSATGAYSAIPIDGGEKYSTYPDGVTFGETEIEKYKESAILIDKSLSYIRGIK